MLFNDRLKLAVAQSHRARERLAVLFVDIDGFKLINDSLGHGVGDRVLEKVAERLVSCVREGDTVARLGGDEFVLILPGLDRAEEVPPGGGEDPDRACGVRCAPRGESSSSPRAWA